MKDGTTLFILPLVHSPNCLAALGRFPLNLTILTMVLVRTIPEAATAFPSSLQVYGLLH